MEERNRLLLTTLRELQREGVLKELILIGSWCQFFYKHYFNNAREIPLVRTLDLDFLIPSRQKIREEVNLPLLLNRLGFEEIRSYPSGYKKYVHPVLTVEFLTPELGRGKNRPYIVEKLHVNAQGLRFLQILQEHAIEINFKNIRVKVPEPATYVLHKFIIGERRIKKEKMEKDLAAARELGEFLLQDEGQRRKLKKIYNSLPKKWRDKIKKSVEKSSETLFNFLSTS